MYGTSTRRAGLLCALAGAAALIPATAASAALGAGRVGAVTIDRDADGRVDAVRIELPPHTGRAARVTVAGHRTLGIRRRGPARGRVTVIVRVTERAEPDTASRPLVSIPARSRQPGLRIRPRDGAGPVPLSARAVEGTPPGTLEMRFSEPVRFRGTARGERVLAVSGARVASIGRARLTRVIRARLTGGSALPARARARIRRARRGPRIRDRAGNLTVSAAVAVTTATGFAGCCSGEWRTLSKPIDPQQQLALPFGYRSHWLQPWRAYLDTVPAARFRSAVGINFNVPPAEAAATAKLLADSGFRRARMEVPWGAMSYEDPGRIRDVGAVRAKVSALKANGIRPLILLNSNHGAPGPAVTFDARITAPASVGARQVRVDGPTRERLVPGLSGFNGPDGKTAEFIAKSVSPSGVVELSKPLPVSIEAGVYRAAVLRYAPFTRPLGPSGGPHPGFERTLSGWLEYVGAVTREVRDVLGSDDFDVEIWNELNFGSDFLRVERYYEPVPPELMGHGDVEDAILRRTISWLRDPAHGVSGVRIGNGFANQTPFPAGSTSPVGLSALDKHPYRGPLDFPGGATFDHNRSVDALGRPDGSKVSGRWEDSFVPSYRAFFPEYFLSGIQTETLVRDLSPLTTKIRDVTHGRNTSPPGASAAPELWITETGLAPGGSGIEGAEARRRLQAKATLRALVAFVNKGVSALHFYAVRHGDWAMVDPAAPGGGETMLAVRRLTSAMAGPARISVPRALRLEAIADNHDHVQFEGDGTAGHPPLYNREVVAFLPFQADEHRFVVPAYVMTRDMSKELRPESYRLTVGGLDAGRLTARGLDPLTGESVPVSIVSRSGDSAVLETELTDSPRLLVLDD